MMPFIDLVTQYKRIQNDVMNRIQTVLEQGQYIHGPEVTSLENRLAVFTGSKHCITCGNGTDALQIVLMALGIGPGDAVFVPSFTFMATAEVVSLLGATPVFVDVDAKTFNISTTALEDGIKQILKEGVLEPKAIIPVDLFGLPANYYEITKLANEYGLLVLEDGAQSFGATYHGKKTCSFGDAATTSFFPSKPLGCYGDGGAIFTDNDALAAIIRSIRVHGKGDDKYDNVRIGVNSRLDTLQAAILHSKLDIFEDEQEKREMLSQYYKAHISKVVETPTIPDGYKSAWAQYSVLAKDGTDRERIQKGLKERGIPSMVYYPKPLHKQTAFQVKAQTIGECTVSENITSRVFSLPMHPYMDEKSREKIVESINRMGEH